jgi:ABC-2 type transport system ATP-binding protein
LTQTQHNSSGDREISAGTTGDGKTLAIKTVGLTKRFGERVSVDHLNLSVRMGELYSLLGDNGAGKTTTLNMLTTLLKPSEGEFYICGLNGSTQAEKIKGVFGIVSQDVAIYNELTAYENLQFLADLYGLPRKVARDRIKVLLEQAGLADRANDIVGTFSGGMQRKLTIAGALLHEPTVLFMDEPTVGLDPVSRRQIWSSLTELRRQGRTIFLTTHYLEEAEILSDRIGIIREGKLVAEGTISELRDKIQAIRKIVVRVGKRVEQSIIENKLKRLAIKFPDAVSYDSLHNTLAFDQPKDLPLLTCLQTILAELKDEDIPFSKFATVEPSLEQVFLAVSSQGAAGPTAGLSHLHLDLE